MEFTQHISTGVMAPAGNEILAMLKEVEGQTWVAIKPLCIRLKVDWGRQSEKIANNPRFNCRHMPMVGADGKSREMICLPSEQVADWINTINANKVSEEKRTSLLELQKFFQHGLNELVSGRYATMETVLNLQKIVEMLMHKVECLEQENACLNRASQYRGSEAAYGMLARKQEKKHLKLVS